MLDACDAACGTFKPAALTCASYNPCATVHCATSQLCQRFLHFVANLCPRVKYAAGSICSNEGFSAPCSCPNCCGSASPRDTWGSCVCTPPCPYDGSRAGGGGLDDAAREMPLLTNRQPG